MSDFPESVIADAAQRLTPMVRSHVEAVYEGILDSVQEYLTANAQFNIGSRLSTAEREVATARAAIAKLEVERDALREALAALDCSDILGVAESCASGMPRWDHVSAKIDAARDVLIRIESEEPLTAAAQSRIDAAWERHKAASPICEIPPPGWKCSRAPGHDGPCAATPTHTPAGN